jgi:hypothetical protein
MAEREGGRRHFKTASTPKRAGQRQKNLLLAVEKGNLGI